MNVCYIFIFLNTVLLAVLDYNANVAWKYVIGVIVPIIVISLTYDGLNVGWNRVYNVLVLLLHYDIGPESVKLNNVEFQSPVDVNQ